VREIAAAYAPRPKLRPQDQILQEFRNKLRQTEDLISKLAFNLREIQGMKRKPKNPEPETPSSNVMSFSQAIRSIRPDQTGGGEE
jgi:hypothetical protein